MEPILPVSLEVLLAEQRPVVSGSINSGISSGGGSGGGSSGSGGNGSGNGGGNGGVKFKKDWRLLGGGGGGVLGAL